MKTNQGRRTSKDNTEIMGMRFTHPDKELFPEIHLTKIMLAEYYKAVEKLMLHDLKQRPLSLLSCPAGRKLCFFQKHVMAAKTLKIPNIKIREKDGQKKSYTYIEDYSDLVALVQLNVLEIHPWSARIDNVEHPDRIILDLDPAPDVNPAAVIEAAFTVRQMLKDAGLTSFPRVTGGKGIHIVAPIEPKNSWNEVKAFTKMVAEVLSSHDPDLFLSKSSKAERKGKIFVDYLRNERGATAIANYSTRAREGAPVAVPLMWQELERKKKIPLFSISDVLKRIAKQPTDPWSKMRTLRQFLPT